MKPKSTMGTWKKKKLVKGQRASHATGKSKGIVASTMQKYMCRRNRSWKHPLYAAVMGTGEFPRKGVSKRT
jgi:hypothetical protein